MTSPGPLREDIQASMDASGEVVQRLQNEGVTNVGAELRARMAAIPVTDADAGAFFETNRAVFGDRQLHQERGTVEQWVRIHRLRAELGVRDPANGLRYPWAGTPNSSPLCVSVPLCETSRPGWRPRCPLARRRIRFRPPTIRVVLHPRLLKDHVERSVLEVLA